MPGGGDCVGLRVIVIDSFPISRLFSYCHLSRLSSDSSSLVDLVEARSMSLAHSFHDRGVRSAN